MLAHNVRIIVFSGRGSNLRQRALKVVVCAFKVSIFAFSPDLLCDLLAFSPQRGVHNVVKMGGVATTLWRCNSLSRSLFSTAGPLGTLCDMRSFPRNNSLRVLDT